MTKELSSFLSNNFGLEIQGGQTISHPIRPHETMPHLIELEARIAQDILHHGYGYFPLDQDGITLAQSFGPYSRVQLALPYKQSDGSPVQVFATITPDTDFYQDKLTLAFLGRRTRTSVWIPEHLTPFHAQENPTDVMTYLSGANQMSTVGDHEQHQNISIVDPRHLLTAMVEFNAGSHANTLIQHVSPHHRPHAGDTWEEQGRQFLPIVSAQSSSMPENDIVWAPLSFLPAISSTQPTSYVMVCMANQVNQDDLVHSRITPLHANQPGALEALQNQGFATLLQKRMTDNLARRIDDQFV